MNERERKEKREKERKDKGATERNSLLFYRAKIPFLFDIPMSIYY
jgi:hypothetical protein